MNFHGGYDPNMVGGFQVGNDAYQQQGGGRGGGRGGRGRKVKIGLSTMNKNKRRSFKKYRGQGK